MACRIVLSVDIFKCPLNISRYAAAQASGAAQSSQKRNWVYGGFAVLAVAALYLFTAVTVVIEAEQEGAAVSLPGSWLTPGGDGRYLVWPGNYEVLIEAPGYQALQTVIEVESGGRAEFSFKLQELPGRVVVMTMPASSGEVWVGAQQVGTLAGDEILLDKGSYELRVRTPRFLGNRGSLDRWRLSLAFKFTVY